LLRTFRQARPHPFVLRPWARHFGRRLFILCPRPGKPAHDVLGRPHRRRDRVDRGHHPPEGYVLPCDPCFPLSDSPTLTRTSRHQKVHVTLRHSFAYCVPRVSRAGRKFLCTAVQDLAGKRLTHRVVALVCPTSEFSAGQVPPHRDTPAVGQPRLACGPGPTILSRTLGALGPEIGPARAFMRPVYWKDLTTSDIGDYVNFGC